ncbi:MAG: anti-sigma factor family protein [Candidatus Deferrimicrobiaceae bacterium]
MACRDIRETISACVDGEASPEEAASVREHLAACERCRVLERQMRAVGAGVRQVRGRVPDGFREAVFAHLDAEGALPPRKKVLPVSWRWAAVPLAAAAALGFFLLTSREAVRGPVPQGPVTSRVETSASRSSSPVSSAPDSAGSHPAAPVPRQAAIPAVPAVSPQGGAVALSGEDREMLALLDILEDPAAFDANGDAEGMDLLAPGSSTDSPNSPRGGRSGA